MYLPLEPLKNLLEVECLDVAVDLVARGVGDMFSVSCSKHSLWDATCHNFEDSSVVKTDTDTDTFTDKEIKAEDSLISSFNDVFSKDKLLRLKIQQTEMGLN